MMFYKKQEHPGKDVPAVSIFPAYMPYFSEWYQE